MANIALPSSPLAATSVPRPGLGAASLALVKDPLRLALSLLIIINVSRIHQHYAFLAPFRPALSLAAIAVLYAVLKPRTLNPDGLFRTAEAKLIITLAVLACVGAPFGLSLGGSATFILESYSKVIVAALLLIAAIRSTRDLYTFAWAYVVGCGILAWFALFFFGLSQAYGSAVTRLDNLYTYDANDIGVVLLVGLGLTLLVMQTSGRVGRIVALVVLIGIGASLARSGSRGAFVGLVGTVGALLVLLRTVSVVKRAAFAGAVIASLVVAAPPGYWEQMKTLLDLENDYNMTTVDGRKEVTKRGVTYLLAYPVFGLGVDNFWRAECLLPMSAKVRTHRAGTGIRCTPPHNTHVQVAAEMGFTGLAAFWLLVFGGIGRGLRLRKRLPPSWRTGDQEERFLYLATMYLPVAMVGFAVSSTFVTFGYIDIVYIVAALLAGLHICSAKRVAAMPATTSAPAWPPVPAPRQFSRYRPSVVLPR